MSALAVVPLLLFPAVSRILRNIRKSCFLVLCKVQQKTTHFLGNPLAVGSNAKQNGWTWV